MLDKGHKYEALVANEKDFVEEAATTELILVDEVLIRDSRLVVY